MIRPEGHRLFFVAAPVYALLAMGVWTAALVAPGAGLAADVGWHAHSLIVGYAGATLMGFLLLTRRGAVPLGCFALWLLARGLGLAGGNGAAGLAAALDGAALAGAVLGQAPPPWKRRPPALLPVAGSFAGLALAGLGVAQGLDAGAPATPAAALVVAGLLAVVGGRLVPGYLRAAFRRGPGLRLQRSERVTVAAGIVAPLAWLAGFPGVAAAAIAGLAAAQGYRLVRWFDAGLRTAPFLLGLWCSFAWLALGGGLFSAGVIAGAESWQVAGQHLWLVGTLGPLTVGVAARLAAGRAGWRGAVPRASLLAVWALHLAAVLRAVAAFVPGPATWAAAAGAWLIGMACAVRGQLRLGRPRRASGSGR